MSGDQLHKAIEGLDVRRLGGSATPSVVGQATRIFDVQLDPRIAPIWSILYFPPVVQSPFGLGQVINSNQAIGRLTMGQGGVAVSVDFDWSMGGVLQVPASSVQLDVFILATTITDGGQFSAWAVPSPMSARGGWQQNTRTFSFFAPIPSVPPALTFPVPALARSWSLGGLGGGATAGIVETFILASDGTTLEIWNKDFAMNNASGIAMLEDQHVLPRRAAVFSVLQATGPVGMTAVSYRFHLAI
jgi:hypothetical protein